MEKIEKFFDINVVLMRLYGALEHIREEEHVELVYGIDETTPKEMRGDVDSLNSLLKELLTFVFQHTPCSEVTLSLRAPREFIYEELLTFEITETGIGKEQSMRFFKSQMVPFLKKVEGKIFYSEADQSISLSIPFKLNDLGNRRYYRLPDDKMLGKRVLVITQSKILAKSLEKMFHYFRYEVDAGAEAYKAHGSNLAMYDIFVLDRALLNEGIISFVQKVQKQHNLKFVLLGGSGDIEKEERDYVSAYLVKPIMQESIFELIITLFKARENKEFPDITESIPVPVIDMEQYMNEIFVQSKVVHEKLQHVRSELIQKRLFERNVSPEEVSEETAPGRVLNRQKGKEETGKRALDYRYELKNFLKTFENSDIYFRDIVKSKSPWQLKEFAIDLSRQARLIGAERMTKLADEVSQLFVYDNLDRLPVYSKKYHRELACLCREIESCLKQYR